MFIKHYLAQHKQSNFRLMFYLQCTQFAVQSHGIDGVLERHRLLDNTRLTLQKWHQLLEFPQATCHIGIVIIYFQQVTAKYQVGTHERQLAYNAIGVALENHQPTYGRLYVSRTVVFLKWFQLRNV